MPYPAGRAPGWPSHSLAWPGLGYRPASSSHAPSGRPAPSQSLLPYQRAAAGVAGPTLPAILIGKPGPTPSSVLALAAPSPSVSRVVGPPRPAPAAASGSGPRPSRGAGPLLRRSKASDAQRLLTPNGTGLRGPSAARTRRPSGPRQGELLAPAGGPRASVAVAGGAGLSGR